MNTIQNKYLEKCNTLSDINENLHHLKDYAEKCDSVVEMGVRSIVSTWALLAGHPKKMISIDIAHPSHCGGNIDEVYSLCSSEEIDFTFIQSDTLQVEIPECDMLFIDTLHTYDHLTKELNLHSQKVRKYLAFHDTQSCPEVLLAIVDFLQKNKNWVIDLHKMNNNGMLFLKKIE